MMHQMECDPVTTPAREEGEPAHRGEGEGGGG